jgi:hypothetical protein
MDSTFHSRIAELAGDVRQPSKARQELSTPSGSRVPNADTTGAPGFLRVGRRSGAASVPLAAAIT